MVDVLDFSLDFSEMKRKSIRVTAGSAATAVSGSKTRTSRKALCMRGAVVGFDGTEKGGN
jgi:hypothetical protein